MKISDAVDEYLSSRQPALTHKTFRWYTDFLTKFDRWCAREGITDLNQVTAVHVAKFSMENPNDADNTRHHRVQITKTFLRWCAEDEEMGVRKKMIDRIELQHVEQPEVEIFSEEDIKRLFRACDGMRNPHRNRAILHVLLDTGVRASELCVDSDRLQEQTGLLLENLILSRLERESYIRVIGKGRKVRSIGLGQSSIVALKKYLNRERGVNCGSPYVFLSSHGMDEALSVRMLQQLLEELGRRASVENVHPHRFRHTFAVRQLLAGTSDLVLMRLMGHTTLDSTKIYIRAMSQLQARLAAISVVDHMTKPRRNK